MSTEGKVFTFGATSFGRLGTDRDGTTGNSNSTKRTQNTPLEVRYFRNLPVHSLASGDFHMLALAHDCSVYSWGCGSDGQLVSELFPHTMNIPHTRRMKIFSFCSPLLFDISILLSVTS